MRKAVTFVCTTCEYYNLMNLGMPGHISRQTEFDSLTDAFEHMQLHPEHNVEGVVIELVKTNQD